ncbi:hypothetical protein [Natrarchaeobaculum sulfurireducens]|nr:hypothetical protein [Natrarchaeobaculum sulfurireducens]AXR81445.1 RecB family restriction endonuclease, SeqA-like protein [Natrarchaeobaculum sulfurireducens]
MSGVSESDELIIAEIKKETGISYNPDTENVEFTGSASDTEQYISFVNYLVENKYITKSDLPISAARAQTRHLINSTATHEDRGMVRPREIGDGIYLETNHDSASKARYSSRVIQDYVLHG